MKNIVENSGPPSYKDHPFCNEKEALWEGWSLLTGAI